MAMVFSQRSGLFDQNLSLRKNFTFSNYKILKYNNINIVEIRDPN